jgi:hypothetical protein
MEWRCPPRWPSDHTSGVLRGGIHHAGGMESEVAPAEIVKEISSKL